MPQPRVVNVDSEHETQQRHEDLIFCGFVQPGTVEMRGADFDWRDRGWAETGDARAAAASAVLVSAGKKAQGGLAKSASAARLNGETSSHTGRQNGHQSGQPEDGVKRRATANRQQQHGGVGGSPEDSLEDSGGDEEAGLKAFVPGGVTPDTFPQLAGLKFALRRGELLGICGEVRNQSIITAALRVVCGCHCQVLAVTLKSLWSAQPAGGTRTFQR